MSASCNTAWDKIRWWAFQKKFCYLQMILCFCFRDGMHLCSISNVVRLFAFIPEWYMFTLSSRNDVFHLRSFALWHDSEHTGGGGCEMISDGEDKMVLLDICLFLGALGHKQTWVQASGSFCASFALQAMRDACWSPPPPTLFRPCTPWEGPWWRQPWICHDFVSLLKLMDHGDSLQNHLEEHDKCTWWRCLEHLISGAARPRLANAGHPNNEVHELGLLPWLSPSSYCVAYEVRLWVDNGIGI